MKTESRPLSRLLSEKAALLGGLSLFDSLCPKACGRTYCLGRPIGSFCHAAVVLLAVTRQRLRGRTVRQWTGILLYGVAMAGMNVLHAVAHLPLGVAVTREFLGPLTVAAIATARKRELLLSAVTLAGVVLISQPGGGMALVGLLFGLGAAVPFGGYTILARTVEAMRETRSAATSSPHG